MKESTTNTDILPSFSLSRRPVLLKKEPPSARVPANKKKHNSKKPCSNSSIPIPSFQAERENLERIFDSDNSTDGSLPVLQKNQTKKKRKIRSSVPIPSFSSSEDDVLDDDSDILNTKPIFVNDSRKVENHDTTNRISEHSVDANHSLISNPNSRVPVSIHVTTTENGSSLYSTHANISSKEAGSIQSSLSTVPPRTSSPVTAESNLNTYTDKKSLTEDDILQLAVRIARSLDPSTFRFTLVQSELESQTSGAWKRVKTSKLRQFILQQLEPTEEALHAAIDTVFLATDIQSSTKKQFIAQVQNHFPIPFSQLCRTKITRRLTALLNKETSPKVVAMANHDAMENKGTFPTNNNNQNNNRPITVENPGILTDSVSASEEKKVSIVDLSNDTSSSLPPCSITANANRRKEAISTISVLPENPSKDRGGIVAVLDTHHPTKPISHNGEQQSTRTRGVRKMPNVNSSTEEGNFSKRSVHSPVEKSLRKRKASCQLCINCHCSISIDQPTISSLSEKHSNSTVEKNLIKRLQKLEKIADYYEEQTESVRRMLKKHRREIWKKREASNPNKEIKQRPRFLPDAGELGEVMDSIKPRDAIGMEKRRKAQLTVFDRPPAIAQSTLTQLLGLSKTTTCHDVESTLDDRVEETEVDLNDDIVHVNDEDKEEKDASVASGASGEDGYFNSESVPFSRVECRNGREYMPSPADAKKGKSMWISMITGKLSQCLDDLVENPDDADDSSKMNNLFEIVDGSSVPDDNQSFSHRNSFTDYSMLSQRGQTIAQSLIQEIENDVTKSSIFERHCPQWKENIMFALHQNDADAIAAALKQLQSEKVILSKKKDFFYQAMEERSDLLSLFEDALKASLTRFSKESAKTDQHDPELFSPSKSKRSARLSLVSEVPTIRCTASQCGFASPLSVSSRLT